MRELGLRYKGKKCPFRFKNPRFKDSLDFLSNETVVWVKKADADWLISNNPRMFEIMSERGKVKGIESVEKIIVPKQPIDAPEPDVTPKKKRGMPKGGWPSMKNKEEEKNNDNRERD